MVDSVSRLWCVQYASDICLDLSVWSLHVSPRVWMGFLQQVILTMILAPDLEIRAQLYAAAHCSLRTAPVASKDGLNAEDKFRCTLCNDY